MRKTCFCNPLMLGDFGDATHITELWSRMPGLLNAEVYVFLYEKDKRFSKIDNLKMVKLPTLLFGKKIPFLSRILSHIFIIVYSLFLPNVIMAYERQNMLNISGLLISKIKGIPLIYEVNSILEYEKKEKTFLNNIFIKIGKCTEKFTVNHAKKVISVTESIKKTFLEEYKLPEEKIEVIPNAANINLFYPMDKFKCRKELDLDLNVFIVCFVGGLGMGCGAKNIVDVAPYVIKKIPNTQFLIVGDGIYRSTMEQKIAVSGLQDKFIFTGRKPHIAVPKYINASDICIALYENDERTEKTGLSPVKMYEYMACAKPVIGTNEMKGIGILQEYNAGILVDPNNMKDIADNIINLLENRNVFEIMGINGRKLVETEYDWDIIAKKVAATCKEAGEIE